MLSLCAGLPSERLTSKPASWLSFVPSLSRSSTFVADWSGDPITVKDNKLGDGIKPFEKR